MLDLNLWRQKCALAVAALLLVVPASAQDPEGSEADRAASDSEEPTEDEDLESDSEAQDDEEEPEEPSVSDDLKKDLMFQLGDIEEITITGEKSTGLQDAPTSSTSFSAADLQALRIENIADLADYTPNLEINTAFAASNPTIFIRGIGLKDYNANAAGAVAVYQDGVNINAPAIQLGQLFDIERIDVLRGPQGAVNGRNATAGAILLYSALPTGEFDVSANLTYGNYDDKEVEASINIPLIEDMLSMRVSGSAQWRDGYTRNNCAGWDPTRYGFREVTEQTTREVYDGLAPNPGQWDAGLGDFRPVMLRRGAFQTRNDYVYLDIGAVNQVNANGISSITTGNNTPWVLDEDLINPDGSPVLLPDGSPAVAGTPIGIQANVFQRSDNDGVCMLQPPGSIATFRGEAFNPQGFTEGEWRENLIQPQLSDYAGLKRWTNNIDAWAARTIFLFNPMDNMEWMLNAHGQQNRGDSAHLQMLGANARDDGGFAEKLENGFSENNADFTVNGRFGEGYRHVPGVLPDPTQPGEGGGNPYSGFYSSDGIEYIDHWGINGWGKWDFGYVHATLFYDYEWYDRLVQDEGDANPISLFPAEWADSAWQTTEELRVVGEGERHKWTAGFFFLKEELDARNFFPSTLQFEIDQTFQQSLLSWAPYIAGELDLVEEGAIDGVYGLTLEGGVRYTNESKEFTLTSSAIGTSSGVAAKLLGPDTVDETWKEVTYDAKITYTPFSNEYGTLKSYVGYGHGFKGGHFNASLTISGGNNASQLIDPVEPEFIDAVEIGIRSDWLEDRVTLNAAVFRYWYKDLQVFDISNESGELPIQKLLNGDAAVLGAEVELIARPLPGMRIQGSFGWLDSEFTDFTVVKTILRSRDNNPTEVEFDYAGNRLVAAPEFNWSVVSEYEIPILAWGSIIPQWDFNYRSKAFLDPQMLDPISQDGYWLHNARLTYRTPDERIELAFWVSNIFDEEYKVDVFDLTREFDTILEVWGEPRTYGVTLSLYW